MNNSHTIPKIKSGTESDARSGLATAVQRAVPTNEERADGRTNEGGGGGGALGALGALCTLVGGRWSVRWLARFSRCLVGLLVNSAPGGSAALPSWLARYIVWPASIPGLLCFFVFSGAFCLLWCFFSHLVLSAYSNLSQSTTPFRRATQRGWMKGVRVCFCSCSVDGPCFQATAQSTAAPRQWTTVSPFATLEMMAGRVFWREPALNKTILT